MFEPFIGKQIQKIHRLFVYDTETESTMLMEDSLIFVFDDGAVYQLHTQQGKTQLLLIAEEEYYTNWEIDDEERIYRLDENLLPFDNAFYPVKINEYWLHFSIPQRTILGIEDPEFSGVEIVGVELMGMNHQRMYLLIGFGEYDFEVSIVDKEISEQDLEVKGDNVEQKVLTK